MSSNLEKLHIKEYIIIKLGASLPSDLTHRRRNSWLLVNHFKIMLRCQDLTAEFRWHLTGANRGIRSIWQWVRLTSCWNIAAVCRTLQVSHLAKCTKWCKIVEIYYYTYTATVSCQCKIEAQVFASWCDWGKNWNWGKKLMYCSSPLHSFPAASLFCKHLSSEYHPSKPQWLPFFLLPGSSYLGRTSSLLLSVFLPQSVLSNLPWKPFSS